MQGPDRRTLLAALAGTLLAPKALSATWDEEYGEVYRAFGYGTPMLVMVSRAGEPTVVRTFGPETPLWPLASVSKPVYGLSAMWSVEKLAQRVNEFIPRLDGTDIGEARLLHCLKHRAAMPRLGWAQHLPGRDPEQELAEVLGAARRLDSESNYTNSTFALAVEILSREDGSPADWVTRCLGKYSVRARHGSGFVGAYSRRIGHRGPLIPLKEPEFPIVRGALGLAMDTVSLQALLEYLTSESASKGASTFTPIGWTRTGGLLMALGAGISFSAMLMWEPSKRVASLAIVGGRTSLAALLTAAYPWEVVTPAGRSVPARQRRAIADLHLADGRGAWAAILDKDSATIRLPERAQLLLDKADKGWRADGIDLRRNGRGQVLGQSVSPRRTPLGARGRVSESAALGPRDGVATYRVNRLHQGVEGVLRLEVFQSGFVVGERLGDLRWMYTWRHGRLETVYPSHRLVQRGNIACDAASVVHWGLLVAPWADLLTGQTRNGALISERLTIELDDSGRPTQWRHRAGWTAEVMELGESGRWPTKWRVRDSPSGTIEYERIRVSS